MKIEITFRNSDARSAEYFLQKRYHSKASLAKLAKVAILTEVANEAKEDMKRSLDNEIEDGEANKQKGGIKG